MSQYFDEDPTAASDPREVVWSLPDGPLTLVTDHGVFGYGQVDTGTKLLLLSAPPPPPLGDLLDLGCGTGAIALTMARRAPDTTVWAVDVNRRARELCAANAVRNGIVNVRVAAPDEVPDDRRFAAIWSNPPIRIGKPALHALLLRWLDRMTPDGVAHLVVQKHLGADSLQRWLTEHGHPAERVAIGAGFRVLRVRGGNPTDLTHHTPD
jgi:16S rRNA (guanine1207-N2)-methyltransferase